MPELTIFFPAFNEAAGLERTVAVALEVGSDLVSAGDVASFEVLIIDDASTDATPSIADGLADRHAEVRVVHHAHNRRLGGSIRTGLAEARGDYVVYTDADLPFDLAEIGTALRLMRHQDADVVSAYRHHRMSEGARRLVYSYAYNSLIHVVVGLRCRDVNFAAKLIRREVIEQITLRSEGSFIDVELLAKAERRGFRIVQIGVDYFPRSRGTSTLSSVGVIAHMLREMWSILPEIRASGPRAKPS